MRKLFRIPIGFRRPKSWRLAASPLAAVLAIGLLALPANAHTGGKNSPSYVYHNSADVYTVSNDNVSDGHCVYARYFQNGTWKYNGAYSCGPEIAKAHSGASFSITDSSACITGHWVCNP